MLDNKTDGMRSGNGFIRADQGENANALKLIEELRHYQIELQSQNEELRKTYQELNIATQRYRDLWENAPVGYVTYQRSGVIVDANPRAIQILCGQLSMPSGAAIQSFLVPESQTVFQQHLWAIIDDRGNCSTELQVKSTAEPVWIRVETASDDRGEFRSAIMDVSQQRKIESDNKLLQLELQQTQRLDLLHNLSGGIAHDFNNILQVILAYGEILSMQQKVANLDQDTVTEILTAANRGADLTKRLLAFSRKSTISTTTVDLNVCLERFLNTVQRTIGDNILVSFDGATEPLCVQIDPTLIEQAIMNICVNARDAMPNGGELTVKASSKTMPRTKIHGLELPPGNYAVVEIADNGSGMSPDVLSRVFEPFFTTKDEGHGTGMGLAIVYGIIRQHQGSIEVESALGEGTKFRIHLPMTCELPKRADVASIKPYLVNNAGQPMRILLVDDELAIREVIQRTLDERGFEVVTAKDGREAIEIINGFDANIDLLITDALMPYVDGKDVCIAFRSMFPDRPMIVMTGHDEGVLDAEFLASSRLHILLKPFHVSTLLETIEKGDHQRQTT